MKGFDVLHVKSAVKSRNKFDLSKTHLTTMNFGEIVPLYVEETVPGDKFHIKADYFSRLAPLVKPTYGKFSFRTVSAFVPYFQVAEDCEAWFAGKTTWQSYTPVQRHFTIHNLVEFLMNYCVSTGTSTDFDWTIIDFAGTTIYFKWTNSGKYYLKILNSLGYTVPQNVDLQTTSAYTTDYKNVKLSAYPLLSFFKLYNDYMSQSQRYNSSVLSYYLNSVKYNKACTGYTTSTGNINDQFIANLFTSLYLNYDNDYFTSAWQTPNRPINSNENIVSVSVNDYATNGANLVSNSAQDNNLSRSSGGQLYNFSQRALDFLKSFDDWVRRNNYSGSREVQQIYSRFGIKTDDYRTHYAHVLSTDVMPVQVGDVTATADSTNVPLGDYAGKGIMSGSKDINYKSSDYGILFVFGYFTVVPMNPYGFDRRVLRNQPLDYYNPEFDGLGADVISNAEVFEDPLTQDSTSSVGVFGFTERYNAYRYGRDIITGEFRDYHANGDMNCWHTGRNLSNVRTNGFMVAQSSAMNTLPQINSEYNRIFSVTSGNVDHFYMTAQFTVDAVRPMLNLNQVANLGEGDTSVPRNGNVIS